MPENEVPRPGTEGPERSNVNAIVPGPYAYAAKLWRELGWGGVLWLPRERKSPPPDGFTGKNGGWPSGAQVENAIIEHGDGNIGLRLMPGMIAIDQDFWKEGKDPGKLTELEERYGKLPPTYYVTSRGPESLSRKLFYRVPKDLVLQGGIPGVGDVIQFHHRYVMTWPSVNPDDGGNIVKCYDDRGREVEAFSPDDIEEVLPVGWQKAFKAGKERSEASAGELLATVGSNRPAAHSYTAMVREAIEKVKVEGAGRYDTGCSLAIRLQANHCPEEDAWGFLQWYRQEAYASDELESNDVIEVIAKKWIPLAYHKVPEGGREPEPIFEAKRISSTLTNWAKKASNPETTDGEQAVEQPSFFQSSDAIRSRPKLTWIVDGILPERSLGQIFGATGEHKSFALIDLIYQVSNGPAGNFLGKQVLTDGPGLCAMILGEGGGDIGERLSAWAEANPNLSDEHAFFTVDEDLDLLNTEDVKRIVTEMVALSQTLKLPWRLIAFDTQADHMPTGDERNETTFSTLKKHLLVISRLTGAAIMLVHHTGHDDSRERGSSRQRQMLDTVWAVKNHQITFEKMKAGPKPDPITFATREVGDSLVVGVPTDAEAISVASKKFAADVALIKQKLIELKATESDRVTQTALAQDLGWGVNRLRTAAISTSDICREAGGGKGKSTTYWLSD